MIEYSATYLISDVFGPVPLNLAMFALPGDILTATDGWQELASGQFPGEWGTAHQGLGSALCIPANEGTHRPTSQTTYGNPRDQTHRRMEVQARP